MQIRFLLTILYIMISQGERKRGTRHGVVCRRVYWFAGQAYNIPSTKTEKNEKGRRKKDLKNVTYESI